MFFADCLAFRKEYHVPRYEYRCLSCEHVFELKQGFDDEPVALCPQCENQSRRIIRPAPVIFKGSGWYVNDYGRKGRNSGDGADEHQDSKSADKSSEPAATESPKESTTKESTAKESTAKESTTKESVSSGTTSQE